MRGFVRVAAVVTSMLSAVVVVPVAAAQGRASASLTPYAGYLVTGDWYSGPIGTSLRTANSPMVGVQGSLPLATGVSLVGNLGYASGDLQVGLPVFGGVKVGSATTYLYDAGVELGGLAGRDRGAAPFVQGGIGGMSTEIKNSLLNVNSTNVAYTAGVGMDVGLAKGFAVRVQAKDWIGRFDSQDAIGYRVEGNLTHNWALSAGVRVGF
jgi:hypothetical protein